MKGNYNELIRHKTMIPTNRMILRKFSLEDAADVLAYASDEQTLKYLTWSGITNLESAKDVISNYYCNDGVYALELKETKRCIGCIDVRVNSEHEKASFGYVLNREYWSKGYMSEALSAVLQLCFEELELNRVEATHYVGNEGSGKVMEKCGMKLEGLAAQEVKIKGIFHDVVHYGITKDEWKSKEEKFIN